MDWTQASFLFLVTTKWFSPLFIGLQLRNRGALETPRLIAPYRPITYSKTQFHTVQYSTVPCRAVPCHTKPYQAIPCYTSPDRVIPCRAKGISSHPSPSHPTLKHHSHSSSADWVYPARLPWFHFLRLHLRPSGRRSVPGGFWRGRK